ncbi:MAG TPA: inositol monophosphatase family protein [Candidatus Limnocylindrales bacterium]|nr:inositol monophosphatase family protein [Candidatus Limnocylindrales bacterium]
MNDLIDWPRILFECKDNVQLSIQQCSATDKEFEPALGRGAGGDVMKPVDLAAENAIVDTLKQHDVSFTLVSEESGVKKFGAQAGECYVTVDPIDGTTNFTRGLPFYACSIAVSDKPMLENVYVGLVADLFHDVTYTAFKGKGAFRDGEKIKPSKNSSLDDAIIGLDLNTYKIDIIAPRLTALIGKTKHIRHFGANALELCYVADGLTDGFVDLRGKLRTTDVAAAFLILKEAGGTVSTADNQAVNVELDPQKTLVFVASANMQIHEKILSLVKTPC